MPARSAAGRHLVAPKGTIKAPLVGGEPWDSTEQASCPRMVGSAMSLNRLALSLSSELNCPLADATHWRRATCRWRIRDTRVTAYKLLMNSLTRGADELHRGWHMRHALRAERDWRIQKATYGPSPAGVFLPSRAVKTLRPKKKGSPQANPAGSGLGKAMLLKAMKLGLVPNS